MTLMKKMVATATALALIGSAANLNAQCYRTDAGGYGYQESCCAPSLAPAIALGTIAIVAIVAVAVQNSSHSSHGHSCHN